MKSNGQNKQKAERFQHAQDLPAAYLELEEAIEALREAEERGPVPFLPVKKMGATDYSYCGLWQMADEKAAAWNRLGAAARRVQVAISGTKNAARTDGFKGLEVTP